MEGDEKRKNHPTGHENHGVHLCHKCGWQFPNPHPSAKHRRAHKKVCGKIDGSRIAGSGEKQHSGSDSDEIQKRKSSAEKVGGTAHGVSSRSGEELFADAVAEFGDAESHRTVEAVVISGKPLCQNDSILDNQILNCNALECETKHVNGVVCFEDNAVQATHDVIEASTFNNKTDEAVEVILPSNSGNFLLSTSSPLEPKAATNDLIENPNDISILDVNPVPFLDTDSGTGGNVEGGECQILFATAAPSTAEYVNFLEASNSTLIKDESFKDAPMDFSLTRDESFKDALMDFSLTRGESFKDAAMGFSLARAVSFNDTVKDFAMKDSKISSSSGQEVQNNVLDSHDQGDGPSKLELGCIEFEAVDHLGAIADNNQVSRSSLHDDSRAEMLEKLVEDMHASDLEALPLKYGTDMLYDASKECLPSHPEVNQTLICTKAIENDPNCSGLTLEDSPTVSSLSKPIESSNVFPAIARAWEVNLPLDGQGYSLMSKELINVGDQSMVNCTTEVNCSKILGSDSNYPRECKPDDSVVNLVEAYVIHSDSENSKQGYCGDSDPHPGLSHEISLEAPVVPIPGASNAGPVDSDSSVDDHHKMSRGSNVFNMHEEIEISHPVIVGGCGEARARDENSLCSMHTSQESTSGVAVMDPHIYEISKVNALTGNLVSGCCEERARDENSLFSGNTSHESTATIAVMNPHLHEISEENVVAGNLEFSEGTNMLASMESKGTGTESYFLECLSVGSSIQSNSNPEIDEAGSNEYACEKSVKSPIHLESSIQSSFSPSKGAFDCSFDEDANEVDNNVPNQVAKTSVSDDYADSANQTDTLGSYGASASECNELGLGDKFGGFVEANGSEDEMHSDASMEFVAFGSPHTQKRFTVYDANPQPDDLMHDGQKTNIHDLEGKSDMESDVALQLSTYSIQGPNSNIDVHMTSTTDFLSPSPGSESTALTNESMENPVSNSNGDVSSSVATIVSNVHRDHIGDKIVPVSALYEDEFFSDSNKNINSITVGSGSLTDTVKDPFDLPEQRDENEISPSMQLESEDGSCPHVSIDEVAEARLHMDHEADVYEVTDKSLSVFSACKVLPSGSSKVKEIAHDYITTLKAEIIETKNNELMGKKVDEPFISMPKDSTANELDQIEDLKMGELHHMGNISHASEPVAEAHLNSLETLSDSSRDLTSDNLVNACDVQATQSQPEECKLGFSVEDHGVLREHFPDEAVVCLAGGMVNACDVQETQSQPEECKLGFSVEDHGVSREHFPEEAVLCLAGGIVSQSSAANEVHQDIARENCGLDIQGVSGDCHSAVVKDCSGTSIDGHVLSCKEPLSDSKLHVSQMKPHIHENVENEEADSIPSSCIRAESGHGYPTNVNDSEGDNSILNNDANFSVSIMDVTVDSISQTDSVEGTWGSISDGTVLSAKDASDTVPTFSTEPQVDTAAQTPREPHHTDSRKYNPAENVDLNEAAPSFMTLVEPIRSEGVQHSSAEIRSTESLQYPSSMPRSGSGWFPLLQNVANESQSRKMNEEVIARVVSWSPGKPHTPLRNLLVDATSEGKNMDSKPAQDLADLEFHETPSLKDEGTPAKTNLQVSMVTVTKETTDDEWNSPARMPVIKREKRKPKGYWTLFVCCTSAKY